MLIKRSVIRSFGLFDPLYGQGYNEENDFVCRINQYGYSAVSANQAYVYHHEASSFGSRRAELEKRNRARLLKRYPEYDCKVSEYYHFHLDPVEHFASLYLPHRPRILFDLSHLPPRHSATSEFGLKLLTHLAPLLTRESDLYVAVTPEGGRSFRGELSGHRLFDESRDSVPGFDLIYKPSQPFTWQELYRMNRLGARVAFTLEDMHGVRCDRLSSAARYYTVKSSVEMSDGVFAGSNFSLSDFEAYFGVSSAIEAIRHGAAPERLSGIPPASYVLIVGNARRHKAVSDAVAGLRRDWPIAVLAADAQKPQDGPGIAWYASGLLSHADLTALFEKARVVVYPSHDEPLGRTIAEVLESGRPVVAIETQDNRELLGLYPNARLRLVASLEGLGGGVAAVASPVTGAMAVRTWEDVARDYYRALAKLLSTPVSAERLRARWERMRLLRSVIGIG
jgi:glycosyltransferase involved in cell wall biosynthesis